MDQIKLQILTGQLMPGQQVGSVISLSARLKVNPMTINRPCRFSRNTWPGFPDAHGRRGPSGLAGPALRLALEDQEK